MTIADVRAFIADVVRQRDQYLAERDCLAILLRDLVAAVQEHVEIEEQLQPIIDRRRERLGRGAHEVTVQTWRGNYFRRALARAKEGQREREFFVNTHLIAESDEEGLKNL